MARLGSQAVAGYYPFPPSLLPAVAARLDLGAWRTAAGADASRMLVALDPCCGEGVALLGLLQHALRSSIAGEDPAVQLQVVGCELETHRARRARRLWTTSLPAPHRIQVEHSDLFRLQRPPVLPLSAPGAHLLWLNPPYDQDPEYSRLEERFLQWTTPLLLPGAGLLCFIIPRHAVAASATTLARDYQALQVYRLPDPHYEVFKQVIVFGQRRVQPCTLPGLRDPEITRLRELARDEAAIPVLPGIDAPPDLALPRQLGGLPALPVVPVRLDTLRAHLHLWTGGTTSEADAEGVRHLIPLAAVGAHLGLADFCGATHPSALPPLPTHTALILASGMINGQTVQPDAPASDLPPLVITGHFQRVAQPTEVNENAKGEVTSVKYDEQPRLRVDILALTQPPRFYTLKEGTEPTGTADLDQMNTADLLAHYGRHLAGLIQAQFPPLHNPADPAHQLPLPALARPLFAAQAHAVCALLKVIGRLGENPLLVGEMGTGKTAMLLNLAWALAPTHQPAIQTAMRAQVGPQIRLPTVRHALIACPPHLVDNWAREIRRVLPAARVRRIERIADLHIPAPPPPTGPATLGEGLTFDLLSREASKLGHAYSPHALTHLPIPLRQQALADYLSRARRAGLTTMTRITTHLRQVTGQTDLTFNRATTDDLLRAMATLDPVPPTIRCARCGTPTSEDAVTLSAKRARCGHQPRQPLGPVGLLLRPLAALLAPFYPDSATIQVLHSQPAEAATRAPRLLAAWQTVAGHTSGNPSPVSRILLGGELVAAAAPPEPPVEILRSLYYILHKTASQNTAEEWPDAVQSYTRTLTELLHQLLAQPQVIRDAVLEPTLQDIHQQFIAESVPVEVPPIVAPFVRRLLALLSLGPTRTVLLTTLNAVLPLRTLPETPPLPPAGMTGLVDIILRHYDTGRFAGITELLGSLTSLVAALPAPERAAVIPAIVTRLYPRTANQPRPYGTGAALRQACCVLLALLPDPDVRQQLIATLRSSIPLDGERHAANPWEQLNSTLATLAQQVRQLSVRLDPAVRVELEAAYPPVRAVRPGVVGFSELTLDPTTGTLLWERQHPVGTPAPALRALETLLALTPFEEGAPCGEPLVQAIPQPRRVALSRYILKHYRHAYQLVALDEAHEANHAETAQGQAYYRLAALPGTTTVALTGTPMNGYASSVFALWWHLNRGFRRLFRRTDRERFIRQYGYRRLIGRVDDKRRDSDTSRRLRGSQSDAVVGGLRLEVVGEAPGMAPTFLVHLLPHSVPIHLAHLDQVLPPREQQRLPVMVTAAQDPTGAEMLAAYQALMKRLVDQIRASLRDPDLAGKLWGHLFEAGLSYPILCTSDTGNGLDADGQPSYRLTYPASCGKHYAGQVLADAPLFPATMRLPHETTLLTTVRRELAAGRNVIIYLRHTGTPRLAQRLVRVLGAAAPAIYLDVSRVPPAKRDSWITQHVIGRRMPVLLTNAEAVKTGLNCLTPYFKTAVWLEPTMNTATFRQAGARIRRIGSHPTEPIREYLLYYADTAQAAAIDLILQKVQHSQLFDGLDLQTSLAAAGVQNDDLTFQLGSSTVSFGKALYQHLQANHQLLRALPFSAVVAAPVVSPHPPDEPPADQLPGVVWWFCVCQYFSSHNGEHGANAKQSHG